MLRLSIAVEEWLQIGEDINIIFLGMSEGHARVMIDAPREIPVSRSRAREKYLSVDEYRLEEEAMEQKLRQEREGDYAQGKQAEFPLWIAEGSRRNAAYAVYGRGRLARECYNTIFTDGTQRLLAYVNLQRAKCDSNVAVDDESALQNPEIDYIVVAAPDYKSYKGLKNRLRDMRIPKRKIVWISKV